MLIKKMSDDLENGIMQNSTNEKKIGSKKMVLGVFIHVIFSAILILVYLAYLTTRANDSMEMAYTALNVCLWFLIFVLPFLIIGSILILFLLRKKFKFFTIIMIGCIVEIILAVLLPISDELHNKKLENYIINQKNKTIEERATILTTIKDINDCSKLTTFTSWQECIQTHLKTKQDFESCQTQKWGQFGDATDYHGDAKMAEYYSERHRTENCQEVYNPIGAATAKTIADCYYLGGGFWIDCVKQNLQSETDLATCKHLEIQRFGKDENICDKYWAIYQNQIELCDNDSWLLTANNECIENIMSSVDISNVFDQCSKLSRTELRYECVVPAINRLRGNTNLQKQYGKDLCSLVDKSSNYYPDTKNFCIYLNY